MSLQEDALSANRQQPERTSRGSDPSLWVEQYGDYLFRYAMLRLHRREVVEDLVQETFLAGLASRQGFTGKSSERTWLVGILKHKIVDHLRRHNREQPAGTMGNSGEDVEELFDNKGNWRHGPRKWSADPGSSLERQEFREVLLGCLSKLPSRLAEAFSLREIEGLGTEEICKVLQISATNLWVSLHRARMQLWLCLDHNWFGNEPARE